MVVAMSLIKKLRKETGAGVMDAKKALEESGGDMKKARVWIAKKGLDRAAKKSDRAVGVGAVIAYVHHNRASGAMVELLCETDFVARTDEFLSLARELAMQVTSSNPKDMEELLGQAYNRDPKLSVDGLIKSVSGKLGERIVLARFVRYGVGE